MQEFIGQLSLWVVLVKSNAIVFITLPVSSRFIF